MPPRRPKFTGLFPDDAAPDSYWIREAARLEFPPLAGVSHLVLIGRVLPPDPADPTAAGPVGLAVRGDGGAWITHAALPVGPFRIEVPLPPAGLAGPPPCLDLRLLGVAWGNALALLGRVTGLGPLQPWRRQARNRRLRLARVEAAGEVFYDFSNRISPPNRVLARHLLHVGANVLGYFRADLGVGESARCMVRAADAAGLPVALVDLRLPCKNPLGDTSVVARLQTAHPHPVNIVHLDAPGMPHLEHHHGAAAFAGKYTIGYWAWELPEFPDAWIACADHCQEVWAPSHFAAAAIAEKIPLPVLVMPHAVALEPPGGDGRARFGLPRDRYLFLFLYDLNSYSARKNPAAVVEAFRRSGLAGRGAALVIKVHNVAGNEADYARLRAAVAGLPDTVLLDRTLSRREITELEAACDCFVSLHRAEGFGLAVAECMALGKPVISTDWSATAEFVRADNGCPVRSATVTLDRAHGPYARGGVWAEPDLDHAAEWMQRLHADRALGARLGAAARATIAERFAPAVIGARYRRRLGIIAGW